MVKIIYDPFDNQISEIIPNVKFESDKKTIQELVDHYQNGRLNLAPAFQRESVWHESQRRNLIKSMYENMPIPSIFLYEREDGSSCVYDVIDGKQRLESIFMFLGLKKFKAKTFWFKAEWEENGAYLSDYYYYHELENKERNKILSYPIQTITIKGSTSEIAEIFVRINSTGSHLKPQEIRKARYLKSEYLHESLKLANRESVLNYFLKNKILGKEQITRQKHVELVSELILSIYHKGIINKKRSIDEAMKTDALKGIQLKKSIGVFVQTLSTIKHIFPNIKETRFRGVADFYTLFMLIWKWKYLNHLILSDRKRRSLAQAYLSSFGYHIDNIRLKQKNFQTYKIEEGENLFVEYLRTVTSSTDEVNQRKNRERILESVLSDCFSPKDPFRFFNKEQRRIIWYLSKHECKKCKKKLNINNFHIDHITPHSKGGRTSLKNAQLLCPTHNLQKGNK
jgi:uncharacterized protein with ParB-like and HNH nuclease domain